MYRLSPEEHERRLALYNQGLNDRQIADLLFWNVHTIFCWRKAYNLPANKPHKLSREEHEQRKHLFLQGKTIQEIADIVGTSYGAIFYWFKKYMEGS